MDWDDSRKSPVSVASPTLDAAMIAQIIEAVDRLTAASHDFVRSRITRVPASKEKDTYKLPFDAHDAFRGLLVAATHGTIVARLSFPYSVLINRLKDVELLLRDEAQQLGTPGSNTILAHIRHALDVMIGDHRQPAGGSRPNYHYVTELLEQKTCGLNAVPADLYTPATLPAALLKQTHNSAGPWRKKGKEICLPGANPICTLIIRSLGFRPTPCWKPSST